MLEYKYLIIKDKIMFDWLKKILGKCSCEHCDCSKEKVGELKTGADSSVLNSENPSEGQKTE